MLNRTIHKLVVLLPILSISVGVHASEYCVKRFEKDIGKANSELSSKLLEQVDIDKKIRALIDERDVIAGQIASLIASDPNLDKESTRKKIAELSSEQSAKKVVQDKIEADGHSNNERIAQLRTSVPASVQGQLKGCLAAVTPVNTVVNFAIQGAALVATAGMSAVLPEKTLYVDIGEVLHGKPLGGDGALVPKARDDVLEALGIGGDAEKIIKDPKCIFGC